MDDDATSAPVAALASDVNPKSQLIDLLGIPAKGIQSKYVLDTQIIWWHYII